MEHASDFDRGDRVQGLVPRLAADFLLSDFDPTHDLATRDPAGDPIEAKEHDKDATDGDDSGEHWVDSKGRLGFHEGGHPNWPGPRNVDGNDDPAVS